MLRVRKGTILKKNNCEPEVALQTPKLREIQRHEKVTQKWLLGVLVKVTQKKLKSESKVTTNGWKSYFWVTFGSLSPGPPEVTFESLFRVFEFVGVWGSVGLLPGHKFSAKIPDTFLQRLGTDMTGQPGHWTMETIGGSPASYLARTPCVPFFCTLFKGVETEGLLDYQGRAGIISILRWNLCLVIVGVEAGQARKKSTKINFFGPETAGWRGGLPPEGVEVEKFVPSLESLFSLGCEERNLGCPGNFAGMSRTPGGLCKSSCTSFVP